MARNPPLQGVRFLGAGAGGGRGGGGATPSPQTGPPGGVRKSASWWCTQAVYIRPMKHPKGWIVTAYGKAQRQRKTPPQRQSKKNQKLRRRTVRRPSAETRPSLCDEDPIPGALLLGEPAEPHQGKYGEEKERGRKKVGGFLWAR